MVILALCVAHQTKKVSEKDKKNQENIEFYSSLRGI